METQKQTLTRLLNTNQWVCGTVFLDAHIPEFRSLINVLRREGIPVEGRKCRQHNHNSSRLQEWSTSPQKPQGGTSSCGCDSYPIFQIHARNCPSLVKEPSKQTSF